MWHLQRSLYGSRASWGPSAARDHDHGHDLLRDLCCRSHLRHSRLILLSKATSATRLTTKGPVEAATTCRSGWARTALTVAMR